MSESSLRQVSTAAHRPSPTQQARMETDREAGRTRELGEGTSGDWRGSCLDSDRLDWSNTDAFPPSDRQSSIPLLLCERAVRPLNPRRHTPSGTKVESPKVRRPINRHFSHYRFDIGPVPTEQQVGIKGREDSRGCGNE